MVRLVSIKGMHLKFGMIFPDSRAFGRLEVSVELPTWTANDATFGRPDNPEERTG